VRSSYRKVRARQSWISPWQGWHLSSGSRKSRLNGPVLFSAGLRLFLALNGRGGSNYRQGTQCETVAKAGEAVVKNAGPLQHNGYKLAIFRGIVEEELAAISQS